MNKKEVKIRLTEDELIHLNNNVAKTGLSREQYLRLLITDRIPVELLPADYRVILRQLFQLVAVFNEMKNQPMTEANQILLCNALHTVQSTAAMMQLHLVPVQAGAYIPQGKEELKIA